jgi:hypothetical protein
VELVNANGECKVPSLKKRASPTANHAIFVHPPQAECHGRFPRAVRGRASARDSLAGPMAKRVRGPAPRAPRSVRFMTVTGPLANCTGKRRSGAMGYPLRAAPGLRRRRQQPQAAAPGADRRKRHRDSEAILVQGQFER